MIANFFSKSAPVKVFYLVVLLTLHYVLFLVTSTNYEVSLSNVVVSVAFWFVLVLFLLVFHFIDKKNKLTLDNLFALFLIVVLMGSFGETMFHKNMVLSNLVLLFSYRKIYSLKSNLNTKMKLFDAALWIGVATLIYSWSSLFLILVYLAMIIYQKGTLKNVFIPIVGFVAPLFLSFTYFIYFDNIEGFLSLLEFNFNFDFMVYNNLKLLIPITFLSTIILWSIIIETPRIVMVSTRLRKAWKVILFQLLLSIIMVIVSPLKNGSELLFVIFPAVLVMANYLPKTRSTIFRNLILYVFFMISVSVYFL